MPPAERPGDRVVIAVVTRPHGLRGAVRVKVFNPETEVLAAGVTVSVAKPGESARSMRVVAAQPGKETWVVSFEGTSSPEAAEALRGAELSLRRDELPEADEGEFYHTDLIGCAVLDTAGNAFGEVRDVVSYPSVDALVVKRADGEVEIPFVDGIVVSVDLEARTVRIDPSLLEE